MNPPLNPPLLLKPAPKKTPIGLLLALSLLSLVAGLVVIEAAFHLRPQLMPAEIKAFFLRGLAKHQQSVISHETLGYTYAPDLRAYALPFGDEAQRPYTVSTVSLGYDNIGFRDDGLAGSPFAVVVGDSFASCVGVEADHCWVELLEASQGRDFANLGVPGYGPQQTERMLSGYGLPLKPKLVLWLFFQNDLLDGWQFEQFSRVKSPERGSHPTNDWLLEHSNLYMLSAFFWHNRRYLQLSLFSADETIARDSDLAWWLAGAELTNPMIAEGLAATERAMLAGRDQALSLDSETKFVIVLIPSREQIRYADSPFQAALDLPNQTLLRFCAEQAITCLDATPGIRAAAQQQSQPLYFAHDLHLNEQGNQALAEIVAQALAEWEE